MLDLLRKFFGGGGSTGGTGGGLTDTGVTPGTYTGRKYDFSVDSKGRVVAVNPTQCTSWNYQMTTAGLTTLNPSNSYYNPLYENSSVPICNLAMNLDDYSAGALIPPEECTADMDFYAALIPTGWLAAEVIAELWYHNDAGSSEAFVTEIARGYADATPKPPVIVLSGGVTVRLSIAEGDYYYIRFRQTAAALATNTLAAGSYWRWSGHFIDAGDCDACEG